MEELRATQDLFPRKRRKILGEVFDFFHKKNKKDEKDDESGKDKEEKGKPKLVPIPPGLIGKDRPEKTTTTSTIDPPSPTIPLIPTTTETPPKTTATTSIFTASASTTSGTSTPPPFTSPTPVTTPTKPPAVSSSSAPSSSSVILTSTGIPVTSSSAAVTSTTPSSSTADGSSSSAASTMSTSTVDDTSSSSAPATSLIFTPGTTFSTITTSPGPATTGIIPDISAPATTSSSAAINPRATMLSSGQTVGVVIGSMSSFFLIVALAVFACRRWTRHHQDFSAFEPGDSDTLSRSGYSRMEDPAAVPDVEVGRSVFAVSGQSPEVVKPKQVFSKWFSQMRRAIPLSSLRPLGIVSKESEKAPQRPGTGSRRTPVRSRISTMFNRQGSSPSAGRSTPSTFGGRPPGTPFRQSGVSEISSMWAAATAMRDTDSGTFVPTTPLSYPRAGPSGLYQEATEPPLPRIPPEAGPSRRVRISIPEALPKGAKARESMVSSDSRDGNPTFAF